MSITHWQFRASAVTPLITKLCATFSSSATLSIRIHLRWCACTWSDYISFHLGRCRQELVRSFEELVLQPLHQAVLLNLIYMTF